MQTHRLTDRQHIPVNLAWNCPISVITESLLNEPGLPALFGTLFGMFRFFLWYFPAQETEKSFYLYMNLISEVIVHIDQPKRGASNTWLGAFNTQIGVCGMLYKPMLYCIIIEAVLHL